MTYETPKLTNTQSKKITHQGGFTIEQKPLPTLRSGPLDVELILIEGMPTNPMGHVMMKIPSTNGKFLVHFFFKPRWMDARRMDEYMEDHQRDVKKTTTVRIKKQAGVREGVKGPYVTFVPLGTSCQRLFNIRNQNC